MEVKINKEIRNCEFVGCTHIKEECCGIKNAIEAGRISQERYERFCKIYEGLKAMRTVEQVAKKRGKKVEEIL